MTEESISWAWIISGFSREIIFRTWFALKASMGRYGMFRSSKACRMGPSGQQ